MSTDSKFLPGVTPHTLFAYLEQVAPGRFSPKKKGRLYQKLQALDKRAKEILKELDKGDTLQRSKLLSELREVGAARRQLRTGFLRMLAEQMAIIHKEMRRTPDSPLQKALDKAAKSLGEGGKVFEGLDQKTLQKVFEQTGDLVTVERLLRSQAGRNLEDWDASAKLEALKLILDNATRYLPLPEGSDKFFKFYSEAIGAIAKGIKPVEDWARRTELTKLGYEEFRNQSDSWQTLEQWDTWIKNRTRGGVSEGVAWDALKLGWIHTYLERNKLLTQELIKDEMGQEIAKRCPEEVLTPLERLERKLRELREKSLSQAKDVDWAPKLGSELSTAKSQWEKYEEEEWLAAQERWTTQPERLRREAEKKAKEKEQEADLQERCEGLRKKAAKDRKACEDKRADADFPVYNALQKINQSEFRNPEEHAKFAYLAEQMHKDKELGTKREAIVQEYEKEMADARKQLRKLFEDHQSGKIDWVTYDKLRRPLERTAYYGELESKRDKELFEIEKKWLLGVDEQLRREVHQLEEKARKACEEYQAILQQQQNVCDELRSLRTRRELAVTEGEVKELLDKQIAPLMDSLKLVLSTEHESRRIWLTGERKDRAWRLFRDTRGVDHLPTEDLDRERYGYVKAVFTISDLLELVNQRENHRTDWRESLRGKASFNLASLLDSERIDILYRGSQSGEDALRRLDNSVALVREGMTQAVHAKEELLRRLYPLVKELRTHIEKLEAGGQMSPELYRQLKEWKKLWEELRKEYDTCFRGKWAKLGTEGDKIFEELPREPAPVKFLPPYPEPPEPTAPELELVPEPEMLEVLPEEAAALPAVEQIPIETEPLSPPSEAFRIPKEKLIVREPTGPPKPNFSERIGSSLAKVGWKEVLIAVVVTIPLIIGAERVWKHIKQPPSVVTPAREGEGEGEPVKLVTVTPATPEEVVSEAVGPTDTPTPTPTPTSTPTPTPDKEKVVTPTPTPTSTPTPMPEKVQPPCDPDAAFVDDVTVPDGTIFGPGECFDKIWRLRNSGGCIWEVGYTLTFISGDQMEAPDAQLVPLTMPGDTADISATMCAPEAPGTYRSGWRMTDASGQTFGPDVYVEIVVPDPALAKKHVEEAIDLFEQGKSLLEMHDKTGEGDCTLGIDLVRSTIEKCNTALGFDPTNPDAYFYRGMSRITLGDNLNEAIKEIEHALDIGLGDDKKDEAKKVVEEVREILEAPINVHIDPIMFALDWKERKPVDPGPKFSGCVTKVEARWTQSNANDEKELVIWSFNGEAVCQHSNVAKRDNDWDGSNWFEDAGVCMQSGNWCAEVRISGKEVAKGCFEID